MNVLCLLLIPQISLTVSAEVETGVKYKSWKPEKVVSITDVYLPKVPNVIEFQSLPLLPTPDISIKPISNFELKKFNKPDILNIESLALDKIKYIELKPFSEEPIKELSPLDYKFLQAELFFESKQFELALGLYLDILNNVKESRLDEVKFRLSETALALDLYNDFRKWSLELLVDSQYRSAVYENLTSSIRSYDEEIIEPLAVAEEKYKLTPSPNAIQYRILKAQHLASQGNLKEALAALEVKDLDENLFAKANLLKSLILYRMGKVNEALAHLDSFAANKLEHLSFDLKNESLLLLGRLHFQKGNYTQARSFYTRIDQNYIEWLPAMIEMGWAQILQGDYEGASGNMFSLHIDFFKNHFIPDSYLARTVGYLGLCQYGDALKTVMDLKGRYAPLIEKTRSIKDQWGPQEFYELVHLTLKDPKSSEIKGVPKVWVSYLTHDPNFIREQKIINSLEDEINSYNRFTLKVISLEKQNTKRKQALLKKKSLSDSEKNELYWTNIKLHIYKKSREQIRALRTEGLARINQTKTIHKQLAGLALKQKMIDSHKFLLLAFEQVDLLQYEIFAGAGEQLRSVLSGLSLEPRSFVPDKNSKNPDQVKWEFKGEVWKDEIGHFRSSLKNICGGSEPIKSASQQGESL